MIGYREFIEGKRQRFDDHGFDPVYLPDCLFPFQSELVRWAVRKGRAAIFADCGMGKTLMQLVWAENVLRHTRKPVLILTPLAVSYQTVEESKRFGIETARSNAGEIPAPIVVTNYERLHHFKPEDFGGVVCDESSILKNFEGAIRKTITDFMKDLPYRLLCTATAAPNDYVELGTSCEALGVMERKHMLARFFTHDGGETAKWRLKGHAREHIFWRWVCSWARACRKPSDLGFDDGGFHLPELIIRDHVVSAGKPREGFLFELAAVGLEEQRSDLKRTVEERCAMVADLCNRHDRPAVCWANLNIEADTIAKMIPGSVNVQGSDSEEKKEEAFSGFARGDIRVLVSKPSIAGFGLNWQHCAHQTFFPSHSYEQFYQCVRRCWRFGQKHSVTVDIVTTEGQSNVLKNMQRKAQAAQEMFEQLVTCMRNELIVQKTEGYTKKEKVPAWLFATK